MVCGQYGHSMHATRVRYDCNRWLDFNVDLFEVEHTRDECPHANVANTPEQDRDAVRLIGEIQAARPIVFVRTPVDTCWPVQNQS